MRNYYLKSICCLFLVFVLAWTPPSGEWTMKGLQPQLSLDAKGVVRLAFGRADSIFCLTSTDAGRTFSKPAFVGRVAHMHLGTTRGPQLASSAHYSIITAMDKSGNIHWFGLTHSTGRWQYGGRVNDVASSAPEGLMGITADAQDRFYAVWLDVRKNGHNNICFSTLSGEKATWAKNRLVYTSPDGHVCECCKPSIAVNGTHLAILYRNWLHGSRDLYLIASSDAGRSFRDAQKLGTGTWKLNGCPMDGGGLAIDNTSGIHTVWQRDGMVYYCRPGAPEVPLTPGRSCTLVLNANGNKVVALLQQQDKIKIVDVNSKKEAIAGTGGFAKALLEPDGTVLCAWEEDKTVHIKTLSAL